MPDYPALISRDSFAVPEPPAPPPPIPVLRLERTVLEEGRSNLRDAVVCGVRKLSVRSATTGMYSRGFARTGAGPADVPSKSELRFHFAPIYEDLLIEWEFDGHEYVQSAALELFRNVGGRAEKLWTKQMEWLAGCPERGATKFNGSLASAPGFLTIEGLPPESVNVTITQEAGQRAHLPFDCLTVKHSPYKLVLTITRWNATINRPRQAWLFLDVLMHSIKLSWGPYSMVKAPRGDIHADYRDAVLGTDPVLGPVPKPAQPGFEEGVLAELAKARKTPDAGLNKVILPSTIVQMAPPGSFNDEPERNEDFQQYEKMWGNGPRIPLIATALLRRSDNKPTDSDPAIDKDRAAPALGGSRLLWDWSEHDPERWKDALANGATAKTKPYLEDSYTRHNLPVLPANSRNCPHDFGGKRGDPSPAARIFPDRDGSHPLGYRVDHCNVRSWAAWSSFGQTPAPAPTCTSAAVFQPARMAGDSYLIRVYMDFVQPADSAADIDAAQALQSEPALFKVFRKIEVIYLYRGSNANLDCDPADVETEMKRVYLDEVGAILNVHRRVINERVYLESLRASIQDLITTETFLNHWDNVALLFSNLINVADPPSDGPAVSIYPRDVFLKKVESVVQAGRMRYLRYNGLGGFKKNFITGQTSGARGEFVWNELELTPGREDTHIADRGMYVLLDPRKPEFQDNEDIRFSFVAKKDPPTSPTVKVRTTNGKSCWGHSITIVTDNAPLHKNKITVRINGVDTVVEYSHAFPTLKLKDDLSADQKKVLLTALQRAASAPGLDETQPITIELRGRTQSVKPAKKSAKPAKAKDGAKTVEEEPEDNAANRMHNLKELLEQQFRSFAVMDRKLFFERWTGKDERKRWNELGGAWETTCTKEAASFLLSTIAVKYVGADASIKDPNWIVALHVAGRTNAPELPEFKEKDSKDLQVTGAFYPDATGKRTCGVVFVSTIPPAKAKPVRYRTPESIMVHEVGHALFLPHPASSTPGERDPGNPRPKVHLPQDNCLMNYDLDAVHFCGMCMLRIRGWNWSAGRQVQPPDLYEYKIELTMGDVDDLFDAADTAQGKMERLQALGLFNHPLKHQRANKCLAYSMEHARQIRALSGADLSSLKAGIADFLMEGSALPAPGRFARMRLPKFNILYSQGEMKMDYPEDFKQYANADDLTRQAYDEKFMLGSDPWAVDQQYLADNPSLGKIPLRVSVKRRPKGSSLAWDKAEPSPDTAVYLQLVAPDALPPYAPDSKPAAKKVASASSFYHQVAGPDPAPVPKKNVDALALGGAKAATDPDRANAPQSLGGKRTSKNRAEVFCASRRDNFGPLQPAGGRGAGYEFAQRIITGTDGEARLCFSPSSVGGDAYKIRAFVGPPTQDKDPKAAGDDRVETGTMVRWRTVRISRSAYAPPPKNASELPKAFKVRPSTECLHPPFMDKKLQTGRVCADCVMGIGDMSPVDLQGVLTLELAKAYNELLLEDAALNPVSAHDYLPAVLNELDGMLKDYRRLNSLMWVRNSGNNATMEIYGHRLTAKAGANDTIFEADLPSVGPLPLNKAGDKPSVLVTSNGPAALMRVAPWEPDSGKRTYCLADRTGSGVLTSGEKEPVLDGGTGVCDYTTGKITVTFAKPQTGKAFGAYYYPSNFLDFRSLLFVPGKGENSPFLFNLRLPEDYNAKLVENRSAAIPMETKDRPQGRFAPKLHLDYILDRDFGAVKILLTIALGRALTRYDGIESGGYCPGLVFVRALGLDNWSHTWEDGTQQGKASGSLILVFGGSKSADMTCSLDSLALHETSHGLYMMHAPNAKGYKEAWHDAKSEFTCVMSYDRNSGDYCGKCVASVRGMKQSGTALDIPLAAGVSVPDAVASGSPKLPAKPAKPYGGLEDTHDIVNVTGDGNCLFRAVAHVVNGNQDGHADLRTRAVTHMRGHRGDYTDQKLQEDRFAEVPWTTGDGYLDTMATPAANAGETQRWGGLQEQRALSAVLGRPIRVYTPRPDHSPTDPGTPFEFLEIMGDNGATPPQHAEPISVYYRGGNHYLAVVPRPAPAPVVAQHPVVAAAVADGVVT